MQRYEHGGNIYDGSKIILDYSANLNPLGMPAQVQQAIASNPARFEVYPDPECRELKRAIAAYHQVSSADILPGNGADDMIYRLAFAVRPRQVLLMAPSFSEYEKSAAAFGADIRYHELKAENNFTVTEAVLQDITEQTDLVYICTPNNPTGITVPLTLIEKIAQRCQVCSAVLVVDECFICFTGKASCVPLLEKYPSMAVLEAFTKRYAMAGLRLGYLISKNHDLLLKLKNCGPCWNVSGPAQAAGIAALTTKDYLADSMKIIAEESAYLKQRLIELGIKVFPSEANYIFFFSEKPLYELLKERGILIRNCDNYPGLTHGYYRICVHTHEKNEKLIQILREVYNG